MVKNKKDDDPFGLGFAIVIILAIIVAQIISYKFELSAIKADGLRQWFCAVVGGIYGIVYYIIKKIKKYR